MRVVWASSPFFCTAAFQAALLVFVSSTARADDAWPMFRGDPQNRGIADTKLPDKLELRWKFATTADEAIESTAAIIGDACYVGGDDGHLYALNLKDGTLRWKFKAAGSIKSSPTFLAGTLYFGDETGIMHAIAAADGKEKWSYKAGGEIISSVVPAGDRLIFGDYDGGLTCLATADGKPLWKYQAEDKLHGTPGIFDGRVLIAGCDAKLHVVRVEDGKADRTIPLGSVCGASAAGDDKAIFLGTYGNQVLAIDWRGSKLVWSFEDSERQFPFISSAAVSPDLVIVGGRDKRVRGFDPKSGEVRWTFTTKGRVDGSPVRVGDRVFIGGMDGVFYELDAKSGKDK